MVFDSLLVLKLLSAFCVCNAHLHSLFLQSTVDLFDGFHVNTKGHTKIATSEKTFEDTVI
jgi:hypothetical protein